MQSVSIGLIVIVGLVLCTGESLAQTVYVSRGPEGELSFSDQPSADVVEVLELWTTPAPLAAPEETSADRVTEFLRVADALAESRMARERQRSERHARNQIPPPPLPVAEADPPVVQRPLWFPPLLPPVPGYGHFRPPYGDRAHTYPNYGRRYPGDGRYDRRDPRLENRALPEPQPRSSRPLPPP